MPALWVMVLANVFNVAANWALIFGHLGFEAQGLVGCAVSSTTPSTRSWPTTRWAGPRLGHLATRAPRNRLRIR